MNVWKIFLFQGCILRFHVNLPGCIRICFAVKICLIVVSPPESTISQKNIQLTNKENKWKKKTNLHTPNKANQYIKMEVAGSIEYFGVYYIPGGGFKYVLFSHRKLGGRFPFWLRIFQLGLKPTTYCGCIFRKSRNHHETCDEFQVYRPDLGYWRASQWFWMEIGGWPMDMSRFGYTSQVVVWDFFHPQYDCLSDKLSEPMWFCGWEPTRLGDATCFFCMGRHQQKENQIHS